jgi:GH15 family glucan-1,4-alpha-glucosidase
MAEFNRMQSLIEDYAIIGNCETVALVARNGAIDWLCLPRFDSAACFAALLGTDDHGRFLIAPVEEACISRAYRGRTLILETVFETKSGAMKLIDFMTGRDNSCNLIRRVQGLRGTVEMWLDLAVRFDYGAAVPWVTRSEDGRVVFVSGPDRLTLQAGVEIENRDLRSRASFEVSEGQEIDIALSWSKSYQPVPPPLAIDGLLEYSENNWKHWAGRFRHAGEYSDVVVRSLITLKALTHFETGGIVAAPTTSLPECIGGPRNWDYRYCWLRDATLTLYALMECDFVDEAIAWRQWLIRAAAGSPEQLQTMYGIAGERQIHEWNVTWLPGYEGSTPVRIGNAAVEQVQLDVYGEILDALYYARTKGIPADNTAWGLERTLISHLESIWHEPDDGIWEQRGGRRQFTHSKIMAWVAVDRAIRSAEEFGLPAPLDSWRELRRQIHDLVCTHGYDEELGSFVQVFGTKTLDAALLMIPLLGFLPADDERVIGTVAAVEKHLVVDGFVRRYHNELSGDGLPGAEGAFLACSFWLADNFVLQGRLDDARAQFERILGVCNDVGLLAEEYDPVLKRQVGNFPQAFSHLCLINTALNLSRAAGPAKQRGKSARSGHGAPPTRVVLSDTADDGP